MAMNQTPASERIHIAFVGKRNAGKSSVMNAVTGQQLAVVSEVKGTTTDPVYKTMELLPIGPVMMIDTPGIDDEGALGTLRVEKSLQVLNKADIAVLVVDAAAGMAEEDNNLLQVLREKNLPYLVVYNKADCLSEEQRRRLSDGLENHEMIVSVKEKETVEAMKNRIGQMQGKENQRTLLEGLVKPKDLVLLVVPIDKAAPKGRLILPQQATIRALLDMGCKAMVVRDTELADTLSQLKKEPALVITDSQVFGKVAQIVPEQVPLTSFSILFARYKGNLAQTLEGVMELEKLRDGDHVLISEGCTHHRQCGDIGTEKLPKWICEYTGKKILFDYTSGTEFECANKNYRLIVHCGGCMLNEREMKRRLECAGREGVAMTNYGILIAYINGILKRCVAPIPEMGELMQKK